MQRIVVLVFGFFFGGFLFLVPPRAGAGAPGFCNDLAVRVRRADRKDGDGGAKCASAF